MKLRLYTILFTLIFSIWLGDIYSQSLAVGIWKSVGEDCETFSVKKNKENIYIRNNGVSVCGIENWVLLDKGVEECYLSSESYCISQPYSDGTIDIQYSGRLHKCVNIDKNTEPSIEEREREIVCDLKDIRYPLTKHFSSLNKIDGKSWRFEDVNISLSGNGLLTISAKQSTNRCEGFTGRIIVDLMDCQSNVLARVYFKTQGIDMNLDCSKAYKGYNDIIQINFEDNPELFYGVSSFSLMGERKSSQKDVKYYVDEIANIAEEIEKIGSTASKIYQLFK